MESASSIHDLLKLPENQNCFDCESPWITSVNLPNGIFICGVCLLEHKRFHRYITYIKPLEDHFSQYELKLLSEGGNKNLKEFFSRYEISHEGPIQLKYQTYASECYRNMLKVKASGGTYEIEHPDFTTGQILLEGLIEEPGILERFSSSTSSLYQSARSKSEGLIKSISKATELTDNSLTNKIGNIFGGISDKSTSAYNKIYGYFKSEFENKK